MVFRVFWGIDAIIALIFIYFFLIGLEDGSVSSFNMALWITILVALGAVLFGGPALRARGQTSLANLVLGILAVPGVLAGVLFLLVILTMTNHH